MGISQVTKKVAKTHPGLGGIAESIIPWLVELSQGTLYDPASRKFYELLTRQEGRLNKPATPEEARELLQEAWWIEREDVSQYLYSVLLMRRFGDGRAISILVAYLVRFLYSQQAFSRQCGWEESYYWMQDTIDTEEPRVDFEYTHFLMDDSYGIPDYDRYLIYCAALGYNQNQIAYLLNKNRLSILREFKRLRKMKEIPWQD